MSVLWHMAVSGTALIAAIVCLRALFLEKLNKGLFPVLWLVAAVRLLTPVSVPVPVSAPVTALLPGTNGAATTAGGSLVPWLGGLWLTGAALAGTVTLLRHIRALRRYTQALPVQNAAIRTQLAGAGLRRTVSVRVCQGVSTPLTYGLLRPVILLPRDWETWTRQELTLALAHESAHIRRLDVLAKYILTAAACLHWPNPFVWVMYALVQQDIELACDEAVLRRMPDGREAYAMALIGLEQRRGPDTLLSGFGLQAVRERVTQIMRYRERSRRSFLAGAVIAVCSLAVFVTAAAGEPTLPQEPAVTPTPAAVQTVHGGPLIPDRGTPPPPGTLPERAVEGFQEGDTSR